MKKVTALFAFIMLVASVGMANAQKIAAMNYEEVLSAMPESKKATADLETYAKSKEAEIKKMNDSFAAEVQKAQAEAAKMTDAQKQAKGAELEKTQQNLQQMQVTAQQDLSKRRESLLQPIVNKLNAAIERAAKANGYDFIVDSSALIYRGGADATQAVKKELGL